jgi:hypothetical protein
MADAMNTQLFNVPIPDPSLLTTEQLRRELAALRDSIEQRLFGMDRATENMNAVINRHPSDTEKAIAQLRDLINEKFVGVNIQVRDQNTAWIERHESGRATISTRIDSVADGIQKQFEERDVRSKAAELAAQVAVGAALQAQKEAAGAQNESNSAAITKSESATVKQIDGILALLSSNSNALNDKIAVINGRLDRGEGKDHGQTNTITMAIAIVAVIAAVAAAIFSYSGNHPASSQQPYSYQNGDQGHTTIGK